MQIKWEFHRHWAEFFFCRVKMTMAKRARRATQRIAATPTAISANVCSFNCDSCPFGTKTQQKTSIGTAQRSSHTHTHHQFVHSYEHVSAALSFGNICSGVFIVLRIIAYSYKTQQQNIHSGINDQIAGCFFLTLCSASSAAPKAEQPNENVAQIVNPIILRNKWGNHSSDLATDVTGKRFVLARNSTQVFDSKQKISSKLRNSDDTN